MRRTISLLAGVTRETKDVPGGEVVRDSKGEPTGLLKDNAMDLVGRAIPPPSREANRAAASEALKEAARFGVTTIQDNLLKVAPKQILTTPVDLTVVSGRVVFERAP